MTDSDSNIECENTEIEDAWDIGCSAIIPEKSKERYAKTYQLFKNWCEEKNVDICEKVLVAYFVQRNQKLKSPGSLWAEYSMLKSTIFLHDSIDISKYLTLKAYLKRKNIGHQVKKASVFTKEEMLRFLTEAPDKSYLILKVGMILGVAGACRREELYNMNISDIEDRGEVIIIKIPNTKTHIQRTFTVTNTEAEKINYVAICRKFMQLRPQNAKSLKLFLNYRNGKCVNQVVGKGTIGSWPSKIAEYLKLKDVSTYTGHSFRRTSATLLANQGVDVLGLKRHGGWKSSAVAESYVEDSLENKIQFAKKILHDTDPSSSACTVNGRMIDAVIDGKIKEVSKPLTFSTSVKQTVSQTSVSANSLTPSLSIVNCTNCTFTIQHCFNK